jgi:hypothetical protein
MKLATLLRTPAPVHAFALSNEALTYGRLSARRDLLRLAVSEGMPVGWFQLGPLGLLQLDRRAVAAALSGVIGRLEKKPTSASLIVPNPWLRTLTVEVGSLPRSRREAEELILWRLKKLLPCRPEEVRLDYVPTGEEGRVLVMLALKRPLEALEETFAAGGVRVGRIESAVAALANLLPGGSGPLLLAHVEERSVGIALIGGGRLLLLRHKPLPGEADRAGETLTRELDRTLAHGRVRLGVEHSAQCWIASPLPWALDAALSWAGGAKDVSVSQFVVGAGRVPATGDIEPFRLWPLLASAWWGE